MQPLISPIDHESRHNLCRAEDERRPIEESAVSEDTPLLQRIPQTGAREPGNRLTKLVVSLLIIILISGIFIGIYLLIIQSESENILPPVETPLQLVSEAQWNPQWRSLEAPLPSFSARHLVVLQTDTQPCYTVPACALLLTNMQDNGSGSLAYNFLVSSGGHTFEALGWRRPSHMYQQYPNALVLAFIGNFTQDSPTRKQIDEARNLIDESVSLRRLDPNYTLIGKIVQYPPTHLFRVLSELPHWDERLSDSY